MGWIITYTKKHFDPVNPDNSLIDIRDIAHSLSLVCRSAGQFPAFYSVGSHCIACEKEARQRGYSRFVCLACLLHDAAEAYLSDVAGPVKQALNDYKKIEKRLLDEIYKKFLGRLPNGEEEKKVKFIDELMLYYEFKGIMNEEIVPKNGELLTEPDFSFKGFKKTEEEFLQIFNDLSEQLFTF